MERKPPPAFNSNPDTGRKGYRMEWEQEDERPLVIYPYPFWTDRLEQGTHEAAVALNAIRPGEGPFSYIKRISEIVTQEREAGAKAMPKPGLSRRERDARLAELRVQAASS